jgi:hypothetical protein
MAEPPVVMFGRSNRDNRWWAVLPSERLVHGDNVTELLDRVDEAMAREAPGRPFALSLDSSGILGLTAQPGRA